MAIISEAFNAAWLGDLRRARLGSYCAGAVYVVLTDSDTDSDADMAFSFQAKDAAYCCAPTVLKHLAPFGLYALWRSTGE